MMKAVTLILSLSLLAATILAQNPDPGIRIGEKFSLRSEVLNEDRPYWVYVALDPKNEEAAKKLKELQEQP